MDVLTDSYGCVDGFLWTVWLIFMDALMVFMSVLTDIYGWFDANCYGCFDSFFWCFDGFWWMFWRIFMDGLMDFYGCFVIFFWMCWRSNLDKKRLAFRDERRRRGSQIQRSRRQRRKRRRRRRYAKSWPGCWLKFNSKGTQGMKFCSK